MSTCRLKGTKQKKSFQAKQNLKMLFSAVWIYTKLKKRTTKLYKKLYLGL